MVLKEPHKPGCVTGLNAVRQGRVVSRMLKNPEQEWAGAVAPAFELVVWGCGQLDGGTAGCVLVLPGVLGCPRFWAVGELLSGFFLSSFSSALAGGRWFGNEAHEGGRGLQSPCSGERRGTGASHPSCKSSRAPAHCACFPCKRADVDPGFGSPA